MTISYSNLLFIYNEIRVYFRETLPYFMIKIEHKQFETQLFFIKLHSEAFLQEIESIPYYII